MRTLSIFLFSIFLISNTIGQVFDNPEVTKIAGGFEFTEGPVWKDGVGLLFSDITGNTIYKWTEVDGKSVYLTPSEQSNGLIYDKNGFLILAQHQSRQVSRLESDETTLTKIVSHYGEDRLNSPNDMALTDSGSIFFTDPPYGLGGDASKEELGYYGIFSITGDSTLHLLDSTLTRPNGIVFSPDQSKLYVSDTEERTIYEWDVVNDSTISNKATLYSNMAFSGFDGMAIDSAGYIYLTEASGVHVISPAGTLVSTIPMTESPANCTFGDADRKTLYVTARTGLYRIRNSEGGTSTFDVSKNKVLMPAFPNPFKQIVNVPLKLDSEKDINISIYSNSGKLLQNLVKGSFHSGLHTFQWNAANYESGIYYIQLTSSDNTITENLRIIKN